MVMGELTQSEVYSPPRTQQVWKSLLSWLAFFFQIFSQIIRSLGHYPLLSSSSSSSSSCSSSSSSTSPSFKPLPSVELQEYDSQSPPPSALEITADYNVADHHRPFQKLTVYIIVINYCFLFL
jgi:RNA polymerase II subunit A small phosphatase-like protein